MRIHNSKHKPSQNGCAPELRPIKEYMELGFVNLDKPANPSSHEVVAWVKGITKSTKTGHAGTLDPMVTGCLPVCFDGATRLVKTQQQAGKEYMVAIKFHHKLQNGNVKFFRALEQIKGAMFQRPPLVSAVKRQLRIRTIHSTKPIEYIPESNVGLFSVKCEAGTYIRSLCVHLGLMLGCGGHMRELRRTRSGISNENERCYTLHDLKDAKYIYDTTGDEKPLREVVQPVENLLVTYKRIILNDSSVSSVVSVSSPGTRSTLTISSVPRRQAHDPRCMPLRFVPPTLAHPSPLTTLDTGIQPNEDIILITTKGEAVALARALMSSEQIAIHNHDECAAIKRVIMARERYAPMWGYGPMAMQKKAMKQSGMLNQYGQPNEATPAEWVAKYSTPQQGPPAKKLKRDNPTDQVAEFAPMPAPPPLPAAAAAATAAPTAAPAVVTHETKTTAVTTPKDARTSTDDKKSKRKEKKENETPEERADRRRKKKERHEAKKAAKAEKAVNGEGSSE